MDVKEQLIELCLNSTDAIRALELIGVWEDLKPAVEAERERRREQSERASCDSLRKVLLDIHSRKRGDAWDDHSLDAHTCADSNCIHARAILEKYNVEL